MPPRRLEPLFKSAALAEADEAIRLAQLNSARAEAKAALAWQEAQSALDDMCSASDEDEVPSDDDENEAEHANVTPFLVAHSDPASSLFHGSLIVARRPMRDAGSDRILHEDPAANRRVYV